MTTSVLPLPKYPTPARRLVLEAMTAFSSAAAVAGFDVAQFEGGRICSLYVFLDPQGA